MVCATSKLSIGGRPAAVEGDTIECRACKSTGVIRCVGPRHDDGFDGRTLALEGDLCACGCATPPTLLAGQRISYQTLDGVAAAAPAPALSADDPTREAPWIGFRLRESVRCEGLDCRVHFDDATQAHATFMRGNRLRIHGLRSQAVQRVDYGIDDAPDPPSLIVLLLEGNRA